MIKSQRTLQEHYTSLAPDEVLSAAKEFFQRRLGIYAAFLEQEGPTHCTFRGQGGEEIVVAVAVVPQGTRVTASTYLFDMQVSRFFATLPASLLGPPVSLEGVTAGDDQSAAIREPAP
jgi:hypothetical protein